MLKVPPAPFAPWAEIVSGYGPVTVDFLLTIPDDGYRLAAKARTYLDGGTRLVWVVWPDRQQVDVWHAGHSVGPLAVLTVDDALDGEDVIPGFAHPVAAVFADPLG